MSRLKDSASEVHSNLKEKKTVKEYFSEKIQALNPFYLNPVFTVVEDATQKMEKFFIENTKKAEESVKVKKK